MKTLFKFLSFFFILPVCAQELEPYKILVKERTAVKSEYKEMELLRSNNENLLIIKNQKKERIPLNKKDSLRMVAMMRSNDTKLNEELISLIKKTLLYKIDTLKLQKENQVFEVTDTFFQNRAKLKKKETENKDDRIILDGTTYQITIADSNGETFCFYSHSPTEKSHPEIYELLFALRLNFLRDHN